MARRDRLTRVRAIHDQIVNERRTVGPLRQPGRCGASAQYYASPMPTRLPPHNENHRTTILPACDIRVRSWVTIRAQA